MMRPKKLSLWADVRVLFASRKGRHRGRPALVARRPVDWQGATVDWDVKAELARADEREPEEQLAEAAEREADELVRHLAELDAAAEESVTAEWSAVLDPVLGPLFAAVDEACRVVLGELGLARAEADWLLAKYQLAGEQTGEYPVVRELVGVAGR